MSAQLRTRSVKLYTYTAPIDNASGIAVATYTRAPSSDDDGCWWASRGVPRGRETAPTTAAQQVTEAVYGFSTEAPVETKGLIVDGAEFYRIAAVLPREFGRDELQVTCVRVDDDAAGFTLVEV